MNGAETTAFSGELCALFGNGVSIAYSQELSLGNLSKKALEQLEQTSGADTEVSDALREFAERMGSRAEDDEYPSEDFEQLIGWLDTFRAATEELSALWYDGNSKAAIATTAALTDLLYREGVQKILSEILDKSTFKHTSDSGREILDFIEAILKLEANSTICNLNYDTIVLAALTQLNRSEATPDYDFCDMAQFCNDGDLSVSTHENGQMRTVQLQGNNLRVKTKLHPEFWNTKSRLVHLHGCLAFWRTGTGNEEIVKVGVGTIRSDGNNARLWQYMLNNKSTFPAVVLSDHVGKNRQIRKHPFSLGYETFKIGLQRSSHWLIAGYSFRDEGVNRCLKEQFEAHLKQGRLPRVLVIDHCDHAEEEEVLRQRTLSALGRPWDVSSQHWLEFDFEGIANATSRKPWERFADTIR